MRCRKAQRLLSAGFDGELDDVRGRAVKEHLAGCPGCQRFAGVPGRCSHALDLMTVAEPGPGFTAGVLARLPESGAKPAWLRDRLEGLRAGRAAAAVVGLSCGVALALSMNGDQGSRVSDGEEPAAALYTESFNALDGDSAEGRYLALLEEKEN